MGKITDPIYKQVVKRNAYEPEFHQAVKEVLDSIEPALEKHPEFMEADHENSEPAPNPPISVLRMIGTLGCG